jgi:hypothetical protein
MKNVDFQYLTTVDYRSNLEPVAVGRLCNTIKLEKLGFTYFDGDGFEYSNGCIKNLYQIRHTLRELTILPDTISGGRMRGWYKADSGSFTALEILHAPTPALFQGLWCIRWKNHLDRTCFEDRNDITHLLPPNLRELESGFKYSSGTFVTSELYMRQFQESSEHESLRVFGWILALLQLRSLRRIRLSEDRCVHDIAWSKQAGGWPTRKYTLPCMVGEAFLKAETAGD